MGSEAEYKARTEQQHLLGILGEECAEVAQQASKAVRFGLDRTKPGTDKTNREIIEQELSDLVAVANMLGLWPHDLLVSEKQKKVRKQMQLSRELGML